MRKRTLVRPMDTHGIAHDGKAHPFDDAECIVETKAAILVKWGKGITYEKKWIPKAVVHQSSRVRKYGDRGQLVLAAWWTGENGLGATGVD